MISFLLPTIRAASHPQILKICIDSIHKHHQDIDYEILIAADQEVVGEDTKCFVEKEHKGPLSAFNFLASMSAGEYLVCIVDDHKFNSPIKSAIDLLESEEYSEEFKITSLSSGGVDNIPNFGDRMGDRIIKERLPVIPTLKFPVIKKTSLKSLKNRVFPPNLTYHAGDIWLSYFFYIYSQPIKISTTQIQQIQQLKNSAWEVEDCNKVYDMILKHINQGYKEYY